MGDYATAYKYLREWIHEKDSINQQDQASIFSDYIIQSQNERLENERLALEDQNHRLRARFFITLVCAIAVILLLLVYQRHRRVERLKEDNMALDKARGEAEKARNQAEKALDVKREFLNNISHELRTPLNPITGFSDILATPEYELQNEERATMSQHIKESSQLLTRIVDHMVELSFYESKQSLPMDSPISPNIICHHMIDAMEPLCPENVHLEFDSKLLSSVRITTNIEGVEKVLAHLIENAFNFTKSGTVTLQCEQQGDKVMIAVADTGCGVAPEQQDTVLELFAATQDRVKTTGMGLSISQAILKLLNGRLWLDKEYKAGARFVFELPIDGTKS